MPIKSYIQRLTRELAVKREHTCTAIQAKFQGNERDTIWVLTEAEVL